MNILITGATGFIGARLAQHLTHTGHHIHGVARHQPPDTALTTFHQADITDPHLNWMPWLNGIDAVIHLAVSHDHQAAATERLAQAAAQARITRFIFLSSALVYGNATPLPVTADTPTRPLTPYARAKLDAEHALRAIAAQTPSFSYTIVRPPSVYGVGMKGSLQRLLVAVTKGIPLPLAGLRNRRSFISIGNLVSAIDACLTHPAAHQQTFLVSDGAPLSTPDMIRTLARHAGVPARLFHCPEMILKTGAYLIHQMPRYQSLCGSLELDISHTRKILTWDPPETLDDAMRHLFHSGGFNSNRRF